MSVIASMTIDNDDELKLDQKTWEKLLAISVTWTISERRNKVFTVIKRSSLQSGSQSNAINL